MSDMHQQMKTCHYCGQAVKMSSHRCPHCDRSLATLDQQHWERSAPSIEPSLNEPGQEVLRSRIRRAPLVVGACCLLVAAVIAISVSRFISSGAAKHKGGEFPNGRVAALKRPEPTGTTSPQSDKTSFIRIHENPAPPDEADASSEGKTDSFESKESSSQEHERLGRIQHISAQILKELLEEETITADTIYLTSGREIDCKIISRSDTQITISHKGVTTTLNRDEIERVEHRSPEEVRRETEKLALAQASEIVSLGLVRHGQLWITPEDKARRMQVEPAQEESEQVPTQAATYRPPPEEPDSQPIDERTDREKLESLLALVRKTKTVDADFFGGTLHIEDRAGGKSDNTSFIAFKAEGRQIDLFQLSDFLRLPVAASGRCNASVEAALNERQPRTLSGEAHITARDVTIPPFAMSTLIIPPNEEATVTATLSADKGAVVIESLNLDGTAYSMAGGGIVYLSDRVEQSLVECTFSILFNESPTVTDTRLTGKGTQYLLNALAASRREISIKVLGTLTAPEIHLTHQSALGSVVWRLDQ